MLLRVRCQYDNTLGEHSFSDVVRNRVRRGPLAIRSGLRALASGESPASDVLGVPRELAGDSDRILPGEGDFSLKPIVEHLRAIGYDGWVSLELFNPTLWQLKPAQVAELGLAALNRLLLPKHL